MVAEQTDLYAPSPRWRDAAVRLPCAGCEQLSSCYPADGAAGGLVTRRLTPLSFYEYRCLALERLHVHYDDFAALLGGRFPGRVAADRRRLSEFWRAVHGDICSRMIRMAG